MKCEICPHHCDIQEGKSGICHAWTMQELDAKRYGVIVTSGHKRGLLLPNLEGVDTPAEQIFISLQKAGIREGEPYQIERFTVERHCR